MTLVKKEGHQYESTINVTFEVGNTYQHIKKDQAKKNKHGCLNEHRWMVYLKSRQTTEAMESDLLYKLVEKVHFGCNGWFGPEYALNTIKGQESSKGPFNGWGSFVIPVTLYWRKETGLDKTTFDYELLWSQNAKQKVSFRMKEFDYEKCISMEVQ